MHSTSVRGPRLAAALSVVVILASARAHGVAEASFTFNFTVEQAIKTASVGYDFVKLHCEVTNTGTQRDSFNIYRDRSETPAAWDMSICIGGENGTCVAPSVNQVSATAAYALRLNPGQKDTISAYFTPADGEGSGYATLTVTSAGDPGFSMSRTVGCVTNGCNALLVDDDGGTNAESYYLSSIPAGKVFGTWRRNMADLESPIGPFPVVVWCTGTNTNTLDADDRQKVGDYLAAGGALLLSGQDIAYDLCDTGSPNYSVASRAWFEDWLNSTYVQNASGNLTLNAVAGDPIAQGLALAISGAGGANNQTDPDVVAPATWATKSWLYGGGGGAGAVRTSPGIYRAAFFGFGFEAISSDANRDLVMDRALTWLEQRVTGVPGPTPGSAAGLLRLESPRPNPLRGSGSISFWLAQPGHATVEIVDLKGRAVNRLVDEQLEGGVHVRQWNGRDLHGSRPGSGVYFVVLRSGSLVASRKLVLAN
jgi:hypothetical protein